MKKTKIEPHQFHRFFPGAATAMNLQFLAMSKIKDANKLRAAVIESLIEAEKNWETPKEHKPVTVSVGSDYYAGRITKVSKSGKTFQFEYNGNPTSTARWSTKHKCFLLRGLHRVSVGFAHEQMDRDF